MLEGISLPKWVFTASTVPHATRCLELLGIGDMFEGIIDVRAVDWLTKHNPDAYRKAMSIGEDEERRGGALESFCASLLRGGMGPWSS
jgi:hypothetical protein